MNGIIHNCTHSDDDKDSVFKELTETDMFGKVLQYIDHIFAVVRPRKLLYLAIDGTKAEEGLKKGCKAAG